MRGTQTDNGDRTKRVVVKDEDPDTVFTGPVNWEKMRDL